MKITLRADSVEIEGYVNAVGRDSRTMSDEYGYPYVEQMQPGVFARALNSAKRAEKPIRMLLNHRADRALGDTESNLTLEEDNIGLHATATVTDPEVIELARSKRLVGWSFGFYRMDGNREYANGKERDVVTEIELEEVSLIDDTMTPVYAGTSVHSRADEEEKQLLIRAANQDAVFTLWDSPQAENKKPEKVDYRYYHTIINHLKGE